MKKKLLTAAIIWTSVSSCLSQQIPIDNQYLVNKFSLSPAYAGYTQNVENFIGVHKSWIGIDGAPEFRSIHISVPFCKNHGAGLTMLNDYAGIFTNLALSFNYAYHVKLSPTQNLSFGIAGGFLKNQIDLSARPNEIIDPIVVESQLAQFTAPDANAGIAYSYKNFNIGVTSFHLTNEHFFNKHNSNNNHSKTVLYHAIRHYRAFVFYPINITSSFAMEPIVVINNTETSPVFYDVAVLFKYNQQLWLGTTYRKNGSLGISLGGVYKYMTINYTYEFGGARIMAVSSGSHEISFGFLLGKNNAGNYSPTVFKKNIQPYFNFTN